MDSFLGIGVGSGFGLPGRLRAVSVIGRPHAEQRSDSRRAWEWFQTKTDRDEEERESLAVATPYISHQRSSVAYWEIGQLSSPRPVQREFLRIRWGEVTTYGSIEHLLPQRARAPRLTCV